MANYASKVIEVALGEEGYLEKETNYNLDNKTGNAGDNNYTKYARDFDKNYPNFYNTKKQSVAWCDIFVDWCLVKAFGVDEALKLLGQPLKSCGAGCYWSMQYYKNIGCFYKSNPKPGDQIFFYNSGLNDIAHTGLVYKVDGTYVYTIEGNTSSASGVVANGGAVAKKKYKLNYTRIAGYGRPKYDPEPTTPKPTVTAKPATNTVDNEIKAWQEAAIKDGFTFSKYGADGQWGAECEKVASKAICKKHLVGYKNINLTKFVQIKVGLTGNDVDGKFGKGTQTAVKAYQKKNGLNADGVIGLNTWRKMLGIPDFWDTIKYFKKSEFKCKCGGKYCDGYPADINETLVKVAERARKYFGKPIIVSSGLRCSRHNSAVGGVSNSRHKSGKAMDFSVQGVTASKVLAWVKQQPEIRYTYAIDGSYVHMDVS